MLSLSLVTAAPVAAEAPTVTLRTGGDGSAVWSTDQALSGSHSVYLHAGDVGLGTGAIRMMVDPIPMAGFTGVSFNVWEPTGIAHGGEFPGAWNIPYPYGDPYIIILLDTGAEGEADFDDALIGTASYTKSLGPAPLDTVHAGPTPDTWVEMAEGYGFRDWDDDGMLAGQSHEWYAGMVYSDPPGHDVWRINDVGTIAEWQGWFATNAPDVTVVGVQLQFGSWLDFPLMGVYVDDVTISGTTYDLEPREDLTVETDVCTPPTTSLVVPLIVTATVPFNVTSTTANPIDGKDYTNVLFNITLSGPRDFTELPSEIFSFKPDVEGIEGTFEQVGGDFVGYWGPPGGFAMPSGYGPITSTFTVEMAAGAPVGSYEVTVELVDVTPEPDESLALATESFTLYPLIGIELSTTFIDFGQVLPGLASAEKPLDIKNIGTVAVDVDAETESVFYNAALTIDADGLDVWAANIAKDGTHPAELVVTVPDLYEATTETGTIIFWVEEATP